MRPNLSSIGALVLLAGTALFLQTRNGDEVAFPRAEFGSFPQHLGTWVGSDIKIAPDVLQVLGGGDFLARDYRDTSAASEPVNLFVAYFPSQRSGDTFHSPKHCLPGSGWLPLESSEVMITLPRHKPFKANRYFITKGTKRALSLYWYQAHGRSVASEYWAKFYQVEDSIRLNRSDGSLVRVTTELGPFESPAEAQERLLALLNVVFPALDKYIPR